MQRVPLELEEEIILPAGMENAPALHFAGRMVMVGSRTPLTAKNRARSPEKASRNSRLFQTSRTRSVSTSNRSCAAAISGTSSKSPSMIRAPTAPLAICTSADPCAGVIPIGSADVAGGNGDLYIVALSRLMTRITLSEMPLGLTCSRAHGNWSC